ncbi:MAG: Transposase IS200 like protein [Chloroflexi bacterium ADurb.Bin120]|jgi:putative transposase|nr:MAG: Transposase IS200 like protein [Chloroflexi bacterium ADurb.Bin120]
MSETWRKSHNISILIYHYVCPAKYRRVVFNGEVDEVLREVCLEIEKRYEIKFIEIGTDKDHVHFLIQSVPMYSAKKIVQTVKSLTAREIFRREPEVKKQLWGGEFWTDGYYVSTVGQKGSEETIRKYVQEQGKEQEYKWIHRDGQFKLF